MTCFSQETGDKVMEAGTIIYIPGPDPSLSNLPSIFPNLEQNQVSTHNRSVKADHLMILSGFCNDPTPSDYGQRGPGDGCQVSLLEYENSPEG